MFHICMVKFIMVYIQDYLKLQLAFSKHEIIRNALYLLYMAFFALCILNNSGVNILIYVFKTLLLLHM